MKDQHTFTNTGSALFIFNEIEFFINCVITHHIDPRDKVFFMDTVLNTSVINFGTKLKILINLNVLTNNEIVLIRKYSSHRNVFAHSNRDDLPTVNVINDQLIDINIEDVIYIPNSEGKVRKEKYTDFIVEHESLQTKVIELISSHITKNNIHTFSHFVTNLKRFLK